MSPSVRKMDVFLSVCSVHDCLSFVRSNHSWSLGFPVTMRQQLGAHHRTLENSKSIQFSCVCGRGDVEDLNEGDYYRPRMLTGGLGIVLSVIGEEML